MEDILQHHLDSRKELDDKLNKYKNLCTIEKKNLDICIENNNNNNDICTHLETLLYNCIKFKEQKMKEKMKEKLKINN